MDFNKSIPLIEKKIHYVFRDKSLLMQAFTRTSFCNEKNYRGRENYSSNEVLEFFGDSVLSCAIISILLEKKTERYAHGIKTELTEGDLSAIRSKLSDKRHLSSRCAELGLQKFLLLGEGDEKLGIAEEASVMEDLFESIIGAIYIDCGMDIKTVTGIVSSLIDVSVYADGDAPIQSYKNALQEWCASKSHRMPPPVYKTLSESGPEHKRVFERGCYIGGKLYGRGVGKNQKEADTSAAKEALATLAKEDTNKEADTDSMNELRALLLSRKAPSAEFHDLGEAPNSENGEHRYIVECTALGITASGLGYSKRDARAQAAKKVLSEVRMQISKEKGESSAKRKAKKKSGKNESKNSEVSAIAESRKSQTVKSFNKTSHSITKEAKKSRIIKSENNVQANGKQAEKASEHIAIKNPRSNSNPTVKLQRKKTSKDTRRQNSKPKQH